MNRLIVYLCVLCAAGCGLLEEDISEMRIEVVSPADRAVAAPGPVDFRWRSIRSAAWYELTVVTPSFAAAAHLVIDSLLRADTVSRSCGCRVELSAGEYEWSLRAFNGGYETPAVVRRLSVAADSVRLPIPALP